MSSIDEEDMGPPPSDATNTGAAHTPDAVTALRSRWRPLSALGKVLEDKPSDRTWLLMRPGERSSVGVLPLGKAGMIAAAGGVGKTMALVQLALGVATGDGWLEHFTTPHPGRVLLALGEEDEEEIHRRMYAAAKARSLTAAQREDAYRRIVALPLAGVPVALVQSDNDGNTTPTPFLLELRARLAREADEADPWRLIILDPLSRFAGVDAETDNAAATRFVQEVESMLATPGRPSILVAHHTTKASRLGTVAADMIVSGKTDPALSTTARGSTALVDGFRWVAALERAGDEAAVFAVTKSNYAAHGAPVALQRIQGGALREMNAGERKAFEDANGAPELNTDGLAEKVLGMLEKAKARTVSRSEILGQLGASTSQKNVARLGVLLDELVSAGRAHYRADKVAFGKSPDSVPDGIG